MEKSESINELATALSKCQGEIKPIKFDTENPFFKKRYASLAAIIEGSKKQLADNGLSITQLPDGENSLITMLMHSSGQWIGGSYSMKPEKATPQGVGSCLSYMRRYAMSAVLGIATEADDDANEASAPVKAQAKPNIPTKPEEKKLITQAQYDAMHKAITNGEQEKVKAAMENYIIKKEWVQELNDAINFSNILDKPKVEKV